MWFPIPYSLKSYDAKFKFLMTALLRHMYASNNGLEWLNQSEGEGAEDFTENHMDLLVPTVILDTSYQSPWGELQ